MFRPGGSAAAESLGIGGILKWRDNQGKWHAGGLPACMKSGQQPVTLGLASVQPSGDAPGGQLVAWLKCG